MQEKYITYQHSKIFYRTSGSGQPIILIHGFGEDGNVWQLQITALQKKYSLIVPDLPGSGHSELINDMSIEGMADCTAAIAAAEKISSSVFLGHSMGGYITLALAEKYPQLISRFGLVHSTAFADSEEKKQARRKSIDFIKENGAYAFLKTTIPTLFYNGNGTPAPAMENLIEDGKKFTPEALISYYEAMINRPDRTDVLTTLDKPVLFIIGEYDNAVPFQQGLQQCYLPAQSHIHILRNAAHMGMYEETEKVNKALLHFLQ